MLSRRDLLRSGCGPFRSYAQALSGGCIRGGDVGHPARESIDQSGAIPAPARICSCAPRQGLLQDRVGKPVIVENKVGAFGYNCDRIRRHVVSLTVYTIFVASPVPRSWQPP